MDYQIHELALYIPEMSPDEYIELKEDIRKNGLLTPLTLYQDKILDGRHRYKACQELGIEATFDYYNGDAPAAFVLSKNIFRRHLTAGQKAAIATDMLPFYEEEAKKRMSLGGQGSPKLDTLEKGRAAEKLGETIGVSKSYIAEAKRLKKENPDLFEKVKSGELSLGKAPDVQRIVVSTNEWYTPLKYLDAARNVLGEFDVDPASNNLANQDVQAKRFYTEEENGLLHDWPGKVWLNPPYKGKAEAFINHLIAQYNKGSTTEAILLINSNSTDTGWFQPLWDYTLCFTNHRINFINSANNEEVSGSTHGSIFVYFGQQKQKFIDNFKQFGAIVERIDK